MLSVAFYAAGVVLVVSGALKLAAPRPTSTMLRGLSSFTRRLPVRLIGIGELSLGMAALVVGGRAIAVLLTIAYLTFTAVSIALLRRGDGLLPCGCLGSRSAPASPAHVVINLGAALVAALAAAANVPGAFPGRFTAGGALDAALACLVAALIITFLRFTPGKLPGVPGSAGLPPPHFGFSDANSVQATRSDALAGSPAGSSGSAQAQPLSHPQAR